MSSIYSGINSSKLRESIINYKDQLDNLRSSLNTVRRSLSSDIINISNNKFIDSLDKIMVDNSIKGSISKLQGYLDNLLEACICIDSIKSYENEIMSLKPYLYYEEEYTYTELVDGEEIEKKGTRTVLDYSVQNKINEKEKAISELEIGISNILK